MKNLTNGKVRYAIKFIDPLTGLLETTFTEITTSDAGAIEITPEFAPNIESDAIYGSVRNRQRNTHKGEENYSFVLKPDVDSPLYEKLWAIHNLGTTSMDLENGLEMKSLRPMDATIGREQHYPQVSLSITEFGGGEASATEQVSFTVHVDAKDPIITDDIALADWPNAVIPLVVKTK